MKCIYDNNEREKFNKEHVIPQLLGTYEPDNLILNNLVCSDCNTRFSKYERIFREDSLEGVFMIMTDMVKRPFIILRRHLLLFDLFINGEKFGMFDSIFPHITPQGTFAPKAQIHMKNDKGQTVIIFVERFRPNREINKLLNSCNKKEIKIFSDNFFSIEDIKNKLKPFGINYNEKEKQEFKLSDQEKPLEINWNITIDSDLRRIPAKIAFNFFVYCARASGYINFLYHETFKDIKEYILGNKDDPDSKIVVLNKDLKWRTFSQSSLEGLNGHFVSFYAAQGKIMADISICNLIHYKVTIGDYIFHTSPVTFGNGHYFDPSLRKRKRLYSSLNGNVSHINIAIPEFGLFTR